MVTTAQHSQYSFLKEEADAQKHKMQENTLIYIGAATCGRAAGAAKIKKVFMQEINKLNLAAEIKEVGCMGYCYAEPIVVISKPGFPSITYGKVDEEVAKKLVQEFLLKDNPCYELALAALEPNRELISFPELTREAYEEKVLLKHCGFLDPLDIDDYISREGYAALDKALTLTPAEIVEEVKQSGLRGRGGAGFSAGEKWEACRETESNLRYVICNGDEGDPGAFMDRSLLESNPHQIIEGMIISAYAVGASKGYIYVRAEYPIAIKRLEVALDQARDKGLLGESILGTNFSFDLEIFVGAGAFVCGEATALTQSIEGKAGIPQTRPPSLAVSGLWGYPTLLNNVKTFAYVPAILNHEARWFKSIGTHATPGTAVFALVGKVKHTGLVEVPMGTTLRTLVFDIGGGVPDGNKFKAVQIGGPSGGCLPESALDVPIDFESLDEAGAIMGSGGLVVMDEEDCMVAIARYFLEFTQLESCGKCTFCRLGTKHMLQILNRITQGEGTTDDLNLLEDLAEDVKMGSLCNLGGTAPNPVLTTLRYFRDEYLEHIEKQRCPARTCKELITLHIDQTKCSKPCVTCLSMCSIQRPYCSLQSQEICSSCIEVCPSDAIITKSDGTKEIIQDKCVKCDECRKVCPEEYNAVVKLSPPH